MIFTSFNYKIEKNLNVEADDNPMYRNFAYKDYVGIILIITFRKKRLLLLWLLLFSWKNVTYWLLSFQDGWRQTTAFKKTTYFFKQDKPLSNDHSSTNGNSRVILSLQNSSPCQRCIWIMAHINYMWDMVRCFVDIWSVSEVVPHWERNISW